ncbi:MAG: hypothetical protein OXT70_03485 [Chloroflexota bacterium]|nr:hypothetical protein [Chloroflexota bacterium]
MASSQPQTGSTLNNLPPRSDAQESVYRALSSLNPALRDLYEGARRILSEDEPLPGWTRFVPHAVREVVRGIPDALDTPKESRLDYGGRLDAITAKWEQARLPLEGVGLAVQGDDRVLIPTDLAADIARLLREHQSSTQTTVRSRFRRLADASAPLGSEGAASQWAEEYHRIHKWAQRNSHEPERWTTAPEVSDYREQFDRFESAVAGLLSDYGQNKGALDDILADTNRRAD